MDPIRFAGRASALIVAMLGIATVAHGHVVLETPRAAAGSYYEAVFRVPHGCDGAPTTAITVEIPDGVLAVKPRPMPTWTVRTQRGLYKSGYELHGRTVHEGVVAVTWTGGPLSDDFYDKFSFVAKLPSAAPGTRLVFPVVQRCADATVTWSQVAEKGQDPHSLEHPAPVLELVPTDHAGH